MQTVFLALACAVALAFQQPQGTTTAPAEPPAAAAPIQYPGTSSELALLMRRMYADWDSLEADMRRGQPVRDVRPSFALMHSAAPTDSELRSDGRFSVHAESFMAALEAFYAAPAEESYNTVVQSCMACHRSLCPGPIKRIKKLEIK